MFGPVFSGATGKFAEFIRVLRQRLSHIFALGVAIGGSELLMTYPLMMDGDIESIPAWIIMMPINRTLSIFGAVAALTAAQVWIPRRTARLVVMFVAVMVVGVGTALLLSSDGWAQLLQYSRTWGGTGPGMFLYMFWINTVFAGLLAILYEWQMRADGVMEALRAARIEGEVVERQTLESRLSGMKARVDPELLFAVVARVEVLYVEDIDAAEQLLEQLIEFLRATLPRSMGAGTTLEQEIKLCSAYLVIEKALRLDALSYQTKSDAGLAGNYFPPSVLLPLLQSLMPPRGQSPRALHFTITAQNRADSVRVELNCHAVHSAPAPEVLDAATAALRAFFGDSASVVAKSAAFTGNTISIEVPHVTK